MLLHVLYFFPLFESYLLLRFSKFYSTRPYFPVILSSFSSMGLPTRHRKANERHLCRGSTDLPLSPAGRAELLRLHYEIENVTSGMKRTEETLEILFGAMPHRQDPTFREVDLGSFEMRSYQELKNDSDYVDWITRDNDANIPPNGESGNQMKARVLAAFVKMEDNTVILTHRSVIAVIMEHLFPGEEKSRYQW